MGISSKQVQSKALHMVGADLSLVIHGYHSCLLSNSHDYNAELGDIPNLRPFEEKFPEEFQDFEKGFIKYMRYVEELESGTIVEEPKRQSAKTLVELETDDTGYPLLPGAGSDPTKDRSY